MLSSLRRGWLTVALLGLLGVVVGVAVSFAVPSRYDASSDVFFSVRASNSLNELSQGNAFVESRLRSYAAVVESPLVLQPVIDELGLETTVSELARHVQADPQLDTVLMTITASSGDAEEATAIADAVVRSLDEAVSQIEESGGALEGAPTVTMTVTSEAVVPTAPAAPSRSMYGALGGVLGLAGGAVVAILRGRVDDTVRRSSDVARALPRTPLLGEIPSTPVVGGATVPDEIADPVREARTLILASVADREHPSVLVAAAGPATARTSFAVELALSLSGTGKRVCLVDADLRAREVSDRLGLAPEPGLTDALSQGASMTDVVRTVGRLSVVPAGSRTADGADLLAAAAFERLVRRLEAQWDVVIVDGPSFSGSADASIIAESVGAVVLVARAGVTTGSALEQAAERISSVRARLVGAVFTPDRPRAPRTTT